uniref:Uncharacterized protein n=1 Tax=viral metagenome TaxID=1070528 RepID=A0A6C0CGT1_9ZZZZ
MECDLAIFQSKLRQISGAILTKECMLEEVLLDIQSCGHSWNETWEALRKACSQLKCSKLKGRVGSEENQVFLEVPILSDIATLIVEVMAGALGVNPEPKREIILVRRQCLSLSEANREMVGSTIEVSLGSIMFEENSWTIDISLLKVPKGFVSPTSTKVVLAKLL